VHAKAGCRVAVLRCGLPAGDRLALEQRYGLALVCQRKRSADARRACAHHAHVQRFIWKRLREAARSERARCADQSEQHVQK
jgi:hypothetical protein